MDAILNYSKRTEDDFYNILGCDELSSAEQICAEFKVKALQCHPDKHPDDPGAAKKFSLLQRAKQVLSEPSLRKDYDNWRLSGIAMPYEEWIARKDCMATSLHWATKSKKEPMLECAKTSQYEEENNWVSHTYWQKESGRDILNKFRNYEI